MAQVRVYFLWRYWLNDGRGGFSGNGTRLDTDGVLSVALADADGDGDLDAILGRMEGIGGNQVFFNQQISRSSTPRWVRSPRHVEPAARSPGSIPPS